MADLNSLSSKMAYATLLNVDFKSTGSGIVLDSGTKLYLVTAKHVLYDAHDVLVGKTLTATQYDPTDISIQPRIFAIDLEQSTITTVGKHDLALIELGEIISRYKDETSGTKRTRTAVHSHIKITSAGAGSGLPAKLSSLLPLKEIELGADVFLLGYPTSLGLQGNEYYDFSRPLLRKGVVAGVNQNKGTFVIDCPSYPGNSGGPVIQKLSSGKFHLIGIVSKYIPFETRWHNSRERIVNIELSNSGYTVCVAVDEIINCVSPREVV